MARNSAAVQEAPAEDTTPDETPADEVVEAEGHAPTRKVRASYLDTSDIAALDGMFLDAVPEQEKFGNGGEARKWHYHNMLSAVKAACEANPDRIGKPIEIARFATNQGANGVRKGLMAGERPVPEGTWEYECGKFTRGDGKGKGSVLYAKYMGD